MRVTTVRKIGAPALALLLSACSAETVDSGGDSAIEPPCRKDFLAAGILPYTIRENRVFLLLGEESRTEGLVWTDFIGTRKDPDCDPAKTAAREFREETRDTYSEAETIEYVRDRPPLVIDPPGVYFWIMPVEDIAPLELRNGPTGRWSEKFTYCWVDLAGLLRAVDEGTRPIPRDCGGRSEQLYSKFEKNVRKGGVSREALEELLSHHAAP